MIFVLKSDYLNQPASIQNGLDWAFVEGTDEIQPDEIVLCD